jgi:ubiquinone/menaquinone biosynthesis C-methylase UbiE
LRKKRFAIFESLISSLPKPLKILDVGGTQIFWERMGFIGKDDLEIVLLNLSKVNVAYKNFKSVVGDARKMGEFKDKKFDVVFSNLAIEHVGNYDQQRQMSEETRRVGKRYFVQTPNRYFLIEPHFLFPFLQFLPLQIKVWLITHFNIEWY